MAQLLDFLISGAVAGALYGILASGLVLTYTTSGVFNFAYGAIAYVTAVLYYELNSGLHWPIAAAALVSVGIFAPALGWLLDRVIFRRLADAGIAAQVVATVGLSIALPGLAIFVVERLISFAHVSILGIDNVTTPPGIGPTPKIIYHLTGTASIDTNEIATLAAAVLAAVGLWVVVRHTRVGLRMRASVDRRELAALRGIDPGRMSTTAWMLSTTLAGLAGVLGAPVLALGPAPFELLMLVSAAAAVFGLLRSVPLAFAGGLALGVIQDIVAGYVQPSIHIVGLSSAVPYVLLFLGLLFLLVDRRRKGGTAAEEVPPSGALHDRPHLGRGIAWAVTGIALAVYALAVADDFWLGLITGGLCIGVIFLSFTVVTGIGGMVSLAQATFVAAAGMVAGLLVSHHVPYLLALLGGVAVSTFVGAAVALFALRLGGLALALATLAFAFIGDLLVFQLNWLINGQLGWTFTRPAIGGLNFASNRWMFVLVFVVGLIGVWLVRNLQRSPSGRAMLAVRSSPVGATASGISAVRVKFALFAVSAAIAGFGGILYVTDTGAIATTDFPATAGLVWLAIVVTFGVRRPAFALVAGVVYELLPQVLTHVTSSTVFPEILFGLGGITLAQNPEGMSDVARRIARAWAGSAVRWRAHRRPVMTGDAAPVPTIAPMAEVAHAAAAAVPGDRRPDGAARLELRSVRAGYGNVEVLHGIDLAIGPGKLVAVLGANGAGKSTLCAVAAGILGPSAGTVRLDGDDVTSRPAFWRVHHGLLLAPESRGIFPGLTVAENLRVLLETDERIERAYERFPVLGERRRLAAGVLSGGEQQMLAIAPALVDPPAVFIADEPSLGLAPRVIGEVFDAFVELRERGSSLMVVEEKVRDVAPIADLLVVLELGRVVWSGPPGDIDQQRLAATYLGVSTERASTS